jgi:hypothetical protein
LQLIANPPSSVEYMVAQFIQKIEAYAKD